MKKAIAIILATLTFAANAQISTHSYNVNGKTVLYPVPNDRGEVNSNCRQTYGIDYANLMKLAEKSSKGQHD
jgi:hypothetical protein